MKNLKLVLAEVLPDITSLGGESRYVDREKLRLLLEGLARELDRSYRARTSLTLLTVALMLVAVARYSDNSILLALVVSVTAIAFAGALATLRLVTEDITRVRLLLKIGPKLSIEALTEVAKRIHADL